MAVAVHLSQAVFSGEVLPAEDLAVIEEDLVAALAVVDSVDLVAVVLVVVVLAEVGK